MTPTWQITKSSDKVSRQYEQQHLSSHCLVYSISNNVAGSTVVTQSCERILPVCCLLSSGLKGLWAVESPQIQRAKRDPARFIQGNRRLSGAASSVPSLLLFLFCLVFSSRVLSPDYPLKNAPMRHTSPSAHTRSPAAHIRRHLRLPDTL